MVEVLQLPYVLLPLNGLLGQRADVDAFCTWIRSPVHVATGALTRVKLIEREELIYFHDAAFKDNTETTAPTTYKSTVSV